MTSTRTTLKKKPQDDDGVPAPGNDEVPTPPPVDEEPPWDRFCDLVLTGGVASGVVYPWAIVELARAYRFRNIGGTSVGAMAAVLAAAAEYGRRTGYERPFETLRRTPGALATVLDDGRTRMLSLFQANPRGRRLVKLWGQLGRGQPKTMRTKEGKYWLRYVAVVAKVLRAYWVPCTVGALVGIVIAGCAWLPHRGASTSLLVITLIVLALLLAVIGLLLSLAWAFWRDLKFGVILNGLGLCKGGTLEPAGPEGARPGLTEWLHDGIQSSAGLDKTDPPLTFRNLWNAPDFPGAAPRPCGEDDPPAKRSINLQMITTNVTHGRPYRLPLADETSRLFFRPEEWKDYFPRSVIDALEKASTPYRPRFRGTDPPAGEHTRGFLQLPGADMPVVVAARLSLSFPLLFSAVPVYAIDYEAPREERTLRRCLLSDGGVSSNFPIHLFDAALPRWPTFGLWLDRRNPHRPKQRVWLPALQGQGWGDNWNRFDPEAKVEGDKPGVCFLFGFLGGILSSSLDWHERTSFRLPHVRNRVAHLLLERGEGGLNIGMTRSQILRMAHRYGTKAGQKFVARFADDKGQASQAWSEQRWVRLELLINGVRERLVGFSASAGWTAHTVPMTEAIAKAVQHGPIKDRGDCNRLTNAQKESLDKLLAEVERLEAVVRAAEPQRFKPVPEPELRLRAPL